MNMRRYQHLDEEQKYSALGELRQAFMSAKEEQEVDQIIYAILTEDERLKIGRRIEIARQIRAGLTYREIMRDLKVGLSTVEMVGKRMDKFPVGYELLRKRNKLI